MMKQVLDPVKFYLEARLKVIQEGYNSEIEIVDNRRFENIDAEYFLNEFIFVVLSAGKSNKAVLTISKKIRDENFNLLVIGHSGRITAIVDAVNNHEEWFKELKTKNNIDDVLEFLESKPFIGKITKYHLARNLGFDVAKPDVHLQRLTNRFGFESANKLCEFISKATGDRIGVIDVVLWRYSSIFGSK